MWCGSGGLQQRVSNTPATGAPGISGTPRTGETLTATTSQIADEDGLTNGVFSYQWIRTDLTANTDTGIDGATGSTYTVKPEEEGHAIKVRVTFTDDAGNEESLTSYAVLDKTGTPLITGSMVSRASLAEHPHDGLGVAVDDG